LNLDQIQLELELEPGLGQGGARFKI